MEILKKNKISLLVIYLVGLSSFIPNAIADQPKQVDLGSTKNKLIQREFNDPTLPKFYLPEENKDQNTNANLNLQTLPQNLETSKLVLSVISIKPHNKTAVINNQIVRENDVIATYHVVNISENKVTLKRTKTVEKVVNKKKKFGHNETDNTQEKKEVEIKEEFLELTLPTKSYKTILDLK